MNYRIPFHTTDWETIPATIHKGETGFATWRTREMDGLRLRMVEYSSGYRADHWCEKGHLLFVLEGELVTELETGETFTLTQGMSYQVSDHLSNHRSVSAKGARLLIVDGTFLSDQRS